MMPLSGHYQVCVVGGGFAGLSAAIQSSRLGMKTILIEKRNQWGGTAQTSKHQFLCGLYLSGASIEPRVINPGFSEEMEKALMAEADGKIVRIGKVAVLQYSSDRLAPLFSRFVQSEKNLQPVLNTSVSQVKVAHKSIEKIEVRHGNEILSFTCDAVIDCSGDGDVIRLSGAAYDKAPADIRQLAAYACQIKDVRSESSIGSLQIAYQLSKAVDQGMLEPHLKYSVWLNDVKGSGVLRISVLPSDSGYEIKEIKKQVRNVHKVLQNSLEEFKYSTVSEMAEAVSEREGLRMTGQYILNEEDVLTANKFEDGAVKGAWPIEFWDQQRGPQYQYLADGQYYEIPRRCLQAKDIENLFAAGRCLSAGAMALASARVTGTCLAMGEQSAVAVKSYLGTERK